MKKKLFVFLNGEPKNLYRYNKNHVLTGAVATIAHHLLETANLTFTAMASIDFRYGLLLRTPSLFYAKAPVHSIP